MAPSPSSSVHLPSARVVEQFQYRAAADVQGLHLWQNHAAWISPGDGAHQGDRLVVLDLGSRTERILTTVPPTHTLGSVAGDANIVVYVEWTSTPTNTNPMVDWTMKSVDLVSGVVQDIASSASPVHNALVPTPTIHLPWIVWAQPIAVPQEQRVDFTVTSYNLKSGHRAVLTDPVGVDGSVELSGSTVVYARNRPPDRSSYDVYARPADGTAEAVNLTNTGYAREPFATDGWVGWLGNSNGYISAAIMGYDARRGRKGRVITVDLRTEGNPRLGKDFVLWLSFGGPLQLEPLPATDATSPVRVADYSAVNGVGRWDAWQNMITWVERTQDGRDVIHIDDVLVR